MSIGWVYAAFVIEKLSTFVTTAVLARLLAPEEFGLIASALLIIGLLSTFRDLGFPDAVIYFEDKSGDTTNSSFWIHVALGTILTVTLFILAPLIAHAFNGGDELVSILRAMSPAMLFGSFGLTHIALIQKRLFFARRAAVDFLAAVLKAGLTIYLAWLGWKEWALVAGFVFSSAFRSLAVWIALPWRPTFHFSRDRAFEMFHYGKLVFAEGVLGNIVLYVDQMAIAALFGSEALAYYFVASRIPDLVLYQVAAVLTTVLFPTIAKLRGDLPAIRRFVIEATRLLSYCIFPVSLGLVATAQPMLETTFSKTWIPAAPFLVILTLRGLLATGLWVVGDGLKAVGRPDILFRITIVEVCISAPLVFILGKFFQSPLAASAGVLIAMFVADILRVLAAKKILGVQPIKFLGACGPAALAALIMWACVLGVDLLMATKPAVLRFGVEVASGIIIYCGSLWLIERDRLLADLNNLLHTSPQSPPPADHGVD